MPKRKCEVSCRRRLKRQAKRDASLLRDRGRRARVVKTPGNQVLSRWTVLDCGRRKAR